jgi:hypothetical protein
MGGRPPSRPCRIWLICEFARRSSINYSELTEKLQYRYFHIMRKANYDVRSLSQTYQTMLTPEVGLRPRTDEKHSLDRSMAGGQGCVGARYHTVLFQSERCVA